MISAYTDGSSSPNPGRGSWAYLIKVGNDEVVNSGVEENSTNNRMELMAVIKVLEYFTEPTELNLTSDSEYVLKGITSWIKKWKDNNWKTSSKTPVLNKDLWEKLDELNSKHKVNWLWVRGHTGNKYNERVDTIAKEARENVRL